jgi:hypothetical protein
MIVPGGVMLVISAAVARPRSATFTTAPRTDEDVRGLEIAMHDAVTVHVVKGGRDRLEQLHRALPAQRCRSEHVSERPAADVLDHQQHVVLIHRHVVDSEQARGARRP